MNGNDLNLDDMRPYSYISTMLPQEYEAEFKRLKAEIERLTRLCDEQGKQINALMKYLLDNRSEAG